MRELCKKNLYEMRARNEQFVAVRLLYSYFSDWEMFSFGRVDIEFCRANCVVIRIGPVPPR
jgi:hypothetical protein